MIHTLYHLLQWLVGRRQSYRIRGGSMRPTLEHGDRVLIDPDAYRDKPPSVGELVLARHPYRRDVEMVKRVGDLEEGDRLVLQGDNPKESTDSRVFGPLPRRLLRGRVVLRIPAGPPSGS